VSNSLRAWKKVYESDLVYIANELKESIERPSVICLTGEMGVGKTTFTKFFALNDGLQSSTYSLVSESKNIIYTDFCRLEGPQDLDEIELDLYMENRDFLLCEWGKPYEPQLRRILGDEYFFYELVIDLNEGKENPSRNYSLFEIKAS
jgi:tRNA threonylcarbamoyladenosine biosynthesis protein TsaE